MGLHFWIDRIPDFYRRLPPDKGSPRFSVLDQHTITAFDAIFAAERIPLLILTIFLKRRLGRATVKLNRF